jgi:hypothetical protein
MRVIKIAISSKAQKLRTRGLGTRLGNETRATAPTWIATGCRLRHLIGHAALMLHCRFAYREARGVLP